MHTQTVVVSARSMLGAAAVAGLLFAGNVAAKDHDVAVALHVNAEGLDLSQPAGAQKFFRRIEHAAWVVCTHGDRVDLEPVEDPRGCQEQAVGAAVRSVKVPMVTQIYLAKHTLQAAAVGWSYVAAPSPAK